MAVCFLNFFVKQSVDRRYSIKYSSFAYYIYSVLLQYKYIAKECLRNHQDFIGLIDQLKAYAPDRFNVFFVRKSLDFLTDIADMYINSTIFSNV